jgi:hypothetical protein
MQRIKEYMTHEESNQWRNYKHPYHLKSTDCVQVGQQTRHYLYMPTAMIALAIFHSSHS